MSLFQKIIIRWGNEMNDLTSIEQRVLTAIKSLSVSGQCTASRQKIATASGLSQPSAVSRATVALEQKGFISVVPGVSTNDWGRTPNVYELKV